MTFTTFLALRIPFALSQTLRPLFVCGGSASKRVAYISAAFEIIAIYAPTFPFMEISCDRRHRTKFLIAIHNPKFETQMHRNLVI